MSGFFPFSKLSISDYVKGTDYTSLRNLPNPTDLKMTNNITKSTIVEIIQVLQTLSVSIAPFLSTIVEIIQVLQTTDICRLRKRDLQ